MECEIYSVESVLICAWKPLSLCAIGCSQVYAAGARSECRGRRKLLAPSPPTDSDRYLALTTSTQQIYRMRIRFYRLLNFAHLALTRILLHSISCSPQNNSSAHCYRCSPELPTHHGKPRAAETGDSHLQRYNSLLNRLSSSLTPSRATVYGSRLSPGIRLL
jgi:hypothetical protein